MFSVVVGVHACRSIFDFAPTDKLSEIGSTDFSIPCCTSLSKIPLFTMKTADGTSSLGTLMVFCVWEVFFGNFPLSEDFFGKWEK